MAKLHAYGLGLTSLQSYSLKFKRIRSLYKIARSQIPSSVNSMMTLQIFLIIACQNKR